MRGFLILAAIGVVAAPAGDDEWVALRQTDGSCVLHPATGGSLLGNKVASAEGRAGICRAAAALKTDDADDRSHCFDYAITAYDMCKAQGVPLPQ